MSALPSIAWSDARVVALAALSFALGCAPPPATHRPGVPEAGRPRLRGPGGAVRDTTRLAPVTAGLHRKRVTEKEPPVTLIAGDGTRCEVTEERFARRSVGDTVLCLWREPGASDR